MYSTVALQLYLVLKYGTQVRVLGSAMFGTGTRIVLVHECSTFNLY